MTISWSFIFILAHSGLLIIIAYIFNKFKKQALASSKELKGLQKRLLLDQRLFRSSDGSVRGVP